MLNNSWLRQLEIPKRSSQAKGVTHTIYRI